MMYEVCAAQNHPPPPPPMTGHAGRPQRRSCLVASSRSAAGQPRQAPQRADAGRLEAALRPDLQAAAARPRRPPPLHGSASELRTWECGELGGRSSLNYQRLKPFPPLPSRGPGLRRRDADPLGAGSCGWSPGGWRRQCSTQPRPHPPNHTPIPGGGADRSCLEPSTVQQCLLFKGEKLHFRLLLVSIRGFALIIHEQLNLRGSTESTVFEPATARTMGSGDLSSEMKRTVLGLTLWVWIAIGVVALLVAILLMICIWVASRRRTKRTMDTLRQTQIPVYSKEIPVDRVGGRSLAQTMHEREQPSFPPPDKHANREPAGATLGHLALSKSSDHDNMSQGSSVCNVDRAGSVHSGEDGSSGPRRKQPNSPAGFVSASPLVGLPEFSHLGWGHWFTQRDLELATNRFSKENVLGEGGYGVVYRGRLVNGTEVAIKKIFNNMGQAEKEFRVEVEAIGHVRHKNLVRLLGYCVEGVNRMLVYEFVNNGNLEQWLHGAMRQRGTFSWENRMKVVTGTAKALAYLHEAIEPKVVHRDIKSSNILIDDEFNGKVSDFGLAKLLGSDKSHITTRVMGTFGYVAPEYANTGMLNEKSDVYSFGVLLLETVTGRGPVDYSRTSNEVNLVEWLKTMVANRRAEEVADPSLEVRPSIRALKRALLVALRCVDPDSEKRPKMGQVVRMLESEEVPYREDRRNRKSRTGSMDIESIAEGSNSAEFGKKVERTGSSTSDRSQP